MVSAPFKDLFDADLVATLGGAVASASPTFDVARFVDAVGPLQPLEIRAR